MLRLIALLMMVSLPAAAQEMQRLSPRQAMNPVQPAPVQIYVSVNGQAVGPMDAAGFVQQLGTAGAAATTYVWMPGMGEWALASTVPALQAIIASIGQTGSGDMAPPADPAAFMLGNWVSESFVWKIKDVPYSAIVQVSLLPNGRFEGVTLFRQQEKLDGPIQMSLEKGTWTVADVGGGKFTLGRDINFVDVIDGKLGQRGRLKDSLVFRATGPDAVISEEDIDFIRIPEGQ